MESVAEDLERKTRAYWILSSVWNNRMENNNIPMGTALRSCTTLMNRINCERPLSHRIWELQEELIEGTGRAVPQESKILPMKKREASA